jgi:hypothetical protein
MVSVMRRKAAMRSSVLFAFDQLPSADTDDVVVQAGLMAQRPETIRTMLSASKSDVQHELDFIDQYVRGDSAAQRVYGAFVDQLERPRGCEAVLGEMAGLSAEERALLLDHYLVIAHRLAQGFRDRVRKCSN